MLPIPVISVELITYLEKICPDRAPSIGTEDRRIWFDAGKVDLVRHLRTVYDQQNETVLQGT
jgi:hypothetical protein